MQLTCVAAVVLTLVAAPAHAFTCAAVRAGVRPAWGVGASRAPVRSSTPARTVMMSEEVDPSGFLSPGTGFIGEAASASDVLADLDQLDSVLGDVKDEADLEPRQSYLNRLAQQAAMRRWQRHENDGGSPEVQIATLTERIVYMTKHLQQNPKDFHSRRGLIAMVTKRRKNLNYLHRTDPAKALEITKALGIRFRPRSAVRGREERYAAFRNTKGKAGMARRNALIVAERERAKQEQAGAPTS